MTRAEVIKRSRELDKLMTPLVAELGKLKAEKAQLLKEWDEWQREQATVRQIATGVSGKKTRVAVELSKADVVALAARFGLKVA